MTFSRFGKILLWCVIVYSLILSSWFVIHGDIVFHSDIARDFSLMSEVVRTGKPTLLGPRTGEVSGLFHGPAWLYLNLPAFLIGHGNPVTVGLWWVILELISLYSIYWVTKKIFTPTVALIVAAVISTRIPLFSHQLFNPSGAFLLFPLFFYFLWEYYNLSKYKHLVVATLLAGLLIQFEVMFGLPMFITLVGIVIYKIFKKQTSLGHLFSLSVILIPLSTYIIFDIRHNFVQLQSLITYIHTHKPTTMTVTEVLTNRISELFSSVNLLTRGGLTTKIVMIILFWSCLIRGTLRDNKSGFFTLYILLNTIFWTFSLIIPEPIKGYYFDFTSLNVMILVSQLLKFNKYVVVLVIIPMLYINLAQAKETAYSTQDFSGNVGSSWMFNKELGRIIVDDAPLSFSVFTLDTDIWGYSANYGIRYASEQSHKNANFAAKSTITYLVIAKNTINHPLFDVRFWREDQVKIKKVPIKSWVYKEIYLIEKYELTPEEAAISEDPLLMSTNMTLR